MVVMMVVIVLVYENLMDGFLYGVDLIELYVDWIGGGDGEFDFASGRGAGGAMDFLSGLVIFGVVVWVLGLYYVSLVLVVMLFFGRIDSEWLSDWLLCKVTGTA